MELKQLEASLIDYYKKHTSEFVQDITMGYIKSNYPENSYKKLHLAILKSHPHSWGFPDVSAIETAAERFMKEENTTLKKQKPLTEYSSSTIEKLTEQEKEENKRQGNDKSIMDSIIRKSVETKDVKDVKPSCRICRFKPKPKDGGFITFNNCNGCGSQKLNFKKELKDE